MNVQYICCGDFSVELISFGNVISYFVLRCFKDVLDVGYDNWIFMFVVYWYVLVILKI